MKKQLPTTVYVYQEQNRDHSTVLLATTDITEVGENVVGKYDLKEIYEHRYQSQVRKKGTKTWAPFRMLLLMLLLTSHLFGQGYTFRALAHPKGADTDSETGLSITNSGVILMSYLVPGGSSYRTIKVFPTGYVLVDTPPFSLAKDLSNTGEIGGIAYRASRIVGFLIRKNGATLTYSVIGKIITDGGALNDFSHKVLSVRDPVTNQFSGVWRDSGGHNLILDYPGAQWTDAHALNNSDAVVGSWFDGSMEHGYLYSNGEFTSIDVPGAIYTSPTCINNNGDIGGLFVNQASETRGFILKNGSFITIDFPVADGVERVWTIIQGLNDKGQAIGTCLIANPAAVNGLEQFVFVATAN